MRAEDFAETDFGAPAQQPGSRTAFTYYLPRPIPRNLPLSTTLVTALSDADAALGPRPSGRGDAPVPEGQRHPTALLSDVVQS